MNSSDIKIINQLVHTQQELGLCPRSIQQSILRQIEAMEKLSKQPQALYYRDGIPVIEVWDDGTEINGTCENAYNDPDFLCITQDATGNLWLNATLLKDSLLEDIGGRKILFAPTSRLETSINASHVVAAFELADT